MFGNRSLGRRPLRREGGTGCSAGDVDESRPGGNVPAPAQRCREPRACKRLSFCGVLEEERAPRTCAAFRSLLPLQGKLVHARWNGEAVWVPLGGLNLGLAQEGVMTYPARGQALLFLGGIPPTHLRGHFRFKMPTAMRHLVQCAACRSATSCQQPTHLRVHSRRKMHTEMRWGGGISETQIMIPYRGAAFGSIAGPLAGNHFLTLLDSSPALRELGERILWNGSTGVSFELLDA